MKGRSFGLENIAEIEAFSQCHYDTTYQLRLVRAVADRLGLYDAADVIERILDERTK